MASATVRHRGDHPANARGANTPPTLARHAAPASGLATQARPALPTVLPRISTIVPSLPPPHYAPATIYANGITQEVPADKNEVIFVSFMSDQFIDETMIRALELNQHYENVKYNITIRVRYAQRSSGADSAPPKPPTITIRNRDWTSLCKALSRTKVGTILNFRITRGIVLSESQFIALFSSMSANRRAHGESSISIRAFTANFADIGRAGADAFRDYFSDGIARDSLRRITLVFSSDTILPQSIFTRVLGCISECPRLEYVALKNITSDQCFDLLVGIHLWERCSTATNLNTLLLTIYPNHQQATMTADRVLCALAALCANARAPNLVKISNCPVKTVRAVERLLLEIVGKEECPPIFSLLLHRFAHDKTELAKVAGRSIDYSRKIYTRAEHLQVSFPPPPSGQLPPTNPPQQPFLPQECNGHPATNGEPATRKRQRT